MKLGTIKATHRPEADVNMGPLIDIVFILLIFFIVTSTFRRDKALPLTRPESVAGTQMQDPPLDVHIDTLGQLYVQRIPVHDWQLSQRVRDALGSLSHQNVLVAADAEVSTQRLVFAIDGCKSGGAQNVSLSVQQGASP